MSYQGIIEAIFGLSLFINAISFIPQIIRMLREKSAKGVSLITFSIFLGSQLSAILYGFIIKSHVLIIGYALSMMTCTPVVILILLYRRKQHHLSVMETNIPGISFKDIIDNIPAHVYWKALDGKCLGASSLQCEHVGHTQNSILGKDDFDCFPKEQAEKIRAIDQEILSSGISKICEEISDEIGSGTRLYLSHKIALRNKKNKIIALLGVSVDITDARKQEIERKNLLETIIALMPGHVYWLDRENVYQGCNDIQAKSAGLSSRMDIVGKRNQDLPWNMNTLVSQIIDQANEEIMRTGQSKMLEEPVSYMNGDKGYCLSSKVPLRDTSGKVVGLLGISIDITEKKKAEEELRKAKEAAEAANRAKTEFLANMSHDVKTPLSGVVGMADLMTHDASERERQRAQTIYLCGMQLLAFFNSCLELSQLEMMEWAAHDEVFSLAQMLKDIDALFSPAAEMKKLNLTIEADADLPAAVCGHRASIYRVIMNLLGNALKFTQQGSVDVKAFVLEVLSPERVSIALEVRDTGIGIPVDKREAIFEKMYRLTPAYEGKIEGSGIGLYIVDQYVKRMSGRIQVESELGVGSTFRVILPLQVVPETLLNGDEENHPIEKFSITNASSIVEIPKTTPSVSTEAPRILLVEDNTLIQHVTQALLNDLGFDVDIAATGAEALEKFTHDSYQLVYMDIGLPDQDGYSVTQAMRAYEQASNKTAVPIIALTAHGAVDVEAFCSRAGMQGVLSKPLTREQANAVWAKFALGEERKVEGLTLMQPADIVVPLEKQIIDLEETINLLGSREYAKELLDLWYEMLIHRFLPAIKDLIEKRDDEGLRHELHTMLGSLCYVKTPLLNQAVLELQAVARNHPNNIETAYQHLLDEAQRFIQNYQQNYQ